MTKPIIMSLVAVEDLLSTLDQNIHKCHEVTKDYHDGYGYISEDTLVLVEELSAGSYRLKEYINKIFGLYRPEAQQEGARFKLTDAHAMILAQTLAELLKFKGDLETRNVSFKRQ